MKSFEVEVRKVKIFCKTNGCENPGGGRRTNHRNVKDFTPKTMNRAIESFKSGIRLNAANGSKPTQAQWRRTSNGWLCPECKYRR